MAPVNPDRKGADDEGRESFWQRLYLTANVTFHVPFYTVLFSFIAYGSLIKYSPNTLVRSALLLYFPYCILDPTPTTGISWLSDATINRIRSLRCFKDAARFLRARLIKTHELDPKQAYILAYHPHGVISMGGNVCLITNGADFPRVFPGIQRWGVTLRQVFWCPFYREWLLINGLVCADKATLQSKLTAGDSIVLVPGGAAEALYAATGRFTLYLNDRKGFIKLAMETGAQVVPCLGFGENAIFDTYVPQAHEGPWAAALQRGLLRVRKYTRFSTPIITRPLPVRQTVHVVVGAPVKFASTKVVDCHAQYLQAVRDLYNEHKANHGHADVPLEFI